MRELVYGGRITMDNGNIVVQDAEDLEVVATDVVRQIETAIANATSIQEVQDIVVAMSEKGINFVSSDGVRVFHSGGQANLISKIRETNAKYFPYNYITRRLGLRVKVLELVT